MQQAKEFLSGVFGRVREALFSRTEQFPDAVLEDPEIMSIEENLHLEMDSVRRKKIVPLLGTTWVGNFSVHYDPKITRHGAFVVRFQDIPVEKIEGIIVILLQHRLTAITPQSPISKKSGMADVEGIQPYVHNYNPMDRI